MSDDTIGDTIIERREEFVKFRGENPMQKALYEALLGPTLAASKLKEELEATVQKAQIVEVPKVIENSDGTTTILTAKEWSYSAPMVDWPTRQTARRDLVKLWGGSPDKKSAGDDDDSPLVIRLKPHGNSKTEK